MEITDVSATKVSTESWGEFEECTDAEGDDPQARRTWMGPVGDVVQAEKPVYELLGRPVQDEISCDASDLRPADLETLERGARRGGPGALRRRVSRDEHAPE